MLYGKAACTTKDQDCDCGKVTIVVVTKPSRPSFLDSSEAQDYLRFLIFPFPHDLYVPLWATSRSLPLH